MINNRYVLTIGIATVSLVLLFAMSVLSIAVGPPQGPPHTNPENGDMFTTGCAQKETGALRVADCDLDTGEGCLNSERCVEFPGVPPPTQSCPSLIGGATGPGPITITEPRHFVYFSGTQDNFGNVGLGQAQQSVERAGSFRNLDVRLTTPPGGDANYVFAFEVNGGVTPITCKISGTDISCKDIKDDDCANVNPGDLISFGAAPTGSVNGTKFRHTVEFDGCLCCDGYPPDRRGNCRPPILH